MPKRPIQHILEDESRTKFSEIIPSKWVVRDKDKDYGIDVEVELFDSEGDTQGMVFWVQLKATASESEDEILNVDMKIDTLMYYRKLDIPVLLVRYSRKKNSFYMKWVYNVDFFKIKEEAKTLRIKFSEEELMTKKSYVLIENRLEKIKTITSGKFTFPLPYFIDFKKEKVKGVFAGIIKTQLRKSLQEYSELLTYEKFMADSFVQISFLNNNELKIEISGLAGCSFHNIESRSDNGFIDEITKDIMLGLATSMTQIGQLEYCGRIVFSHNLQNRLLEKTELLENLLPALFSTSYFEQVLDLISELIDSDVNINIGLTTSFNLLLNYNKYDEQRLNKIEQFHLKRIAKQKKESNNSLTGISHYNLGNHYRNRYMFVESINHYNIARRLNPIYINQHYFYSEVAGVLFLSSKYKLSSEYYKKSIELGGENLNHALYGDALMFSGNYEKAHEAFQTYTELEEKPTDEYVLKEILIKRLISCNGGKMQNRNQEKANKLADLGNLLSKPKRIKRLEEALNCDLLSSKAWFTLGSLQANENKGVDAALSFTMAAIFEPSNIGAWVSATMFSIPKGTDIIMVALLVRAAYSFNGEDYTEELYKQISKTGVKNVNQIIEKIEEVLPDKVIEGDDPIIRVLDNDGIFRNIFKVK